MQFASVDTLTCIQCEKQIRVKFRYCPFCGHSAKFDKIETSPLFSNVETAAHLKVVVNNLENTFEEPAHSDAKIEDQLYSMPAVRENTVENEETQANSKPNLIIETAIYESGGRRSAKIVRRILLVVGITALGFLGALSYLTDRPEANKNSAATITRSIPESARREVFQHEVVKKPVPAEVVPEPIVQMVQLYTGWQSVPVTLDRARRGLSVSSSEPFRMRVNGKLYTVASAAHREIDFADATYFEVKAIRPNTTIKVTRSASSRGYQ